MPLERDQIAEALPSYEVGGELGRGAWGVVVSARHRALARTVAVKQLPRAFAADPAVRARFLTEGRLLASLDHPHIVPVFDFVEKDGLCLLVMELLPQGTVWSRFWAHGFTPPAACATALAAASGLQAAHEKNVLHRDVKPENMMFSSEGVLKVTDFGIAKVVGGDSTLATRAGEVIGTPAYIAPEQARGGPLSPATDVYALATMLYELLSGQLPFADEADAMALLFKHAYEDPVPLDEKASSTPAPVVPVVMRGLATRPEDRYPSAQSFAIALAEACTSVWGPGWLSAEGVAVMGAGSVVAVTERVGVQPTVRLHAAAGPPPPPGARASSPAAPALHRARTTVVRPAASTRAEGAAPTSIEDAAPANFVPLQQVVKAPPKPALPLAIALVAFAVSVLLAFVGVGTATSLGGDIPAGSVRVGGVPLASGATVPVNLSNPVAIAVSPGAPPSSSVRMSLLVLGYRAFQATSPLVAAGGSAKAARADLTTARYFVTGHMVSDVELLRKGTDGEIVVGSWRFIASLSQPAWLTVEGVALILLILFLLAYIEQFTRSLWRAKRRPSATGGLAVSVALLSVAMVAVAWLAAGRQPTLAAVVASAVLGVVSGFALAAAAHRAGRLRRLRRRSPARPAAGAVSDARRSPA